MALIEVTHRNSCVRRCGSWSSTWHYSCTLEKFGIKFAQPLAQLCDGCIGCFFPDKCHFIGPREFRYIKGSHVGRDHKICRLYSNGIHVSVLDPVLSPNDLKWLDGPAAEPTS